MVPDLVQFLALRARLEDLDGVPIINIHDVPLQGLNAVIKRAIDIAISSIALVFVAIPGAFIAITIKLTSKGSIFYCQERMGLDGRPFTVYKFRSMHENAEEVTGPIWSPDDDPRCTPVGRFLRRTDLDELQSESAGLIEEHAALRAELAGLDERRRSERTEKLSTRPRSCTRS